MATDDREVVLEAVRQNGMHLGYATEGLSADPEVVVEAVRQNGMALQFADDELKRSHWVVSQAVRQNPMAFRYAAEDLRADRGMVLDAVVRSGMALQFASSSLRADRILVRAAINQCPTALQHAAKALRADRGIVLEAVRQCGWALQYAAPKLRADRGIVLAAVKVDGGAAVYASEELRADREVLDAIGPMAAAVLAEASLPDPAEESVPSWLQTIVRRGDFTMVLPVPKSHPSVSGVHPTPAGKSAPCWMPTIAPLPKRRRDDVTTADTDTKALIVPEPPIGLGGGQMGQRDEDAIPSNPSGSAATTEPPVLIDANLEFTALQRQLALFVEWKQQRAMPIASGHLGPAVLGLLAAVP